MFWSRKCVNCSCRAIRMLARDCSTVGWTGENVASLLVVVPGVLLLLAVRGAGHITPKNRPSAKAAKSSEKRWVNALLAVLRAFIILGSGSGQVRHPVVVYDGYVCLHCRHAEQVRLPRGAKAGAFRITIPQGLTLRYGGPERSA